MRVFLFSAALVLVLGCSPSEPEPVVPQTNGTPTDNQGGISPVSTAPIGSAPVTGTENLQGSGGGGSGIGSAAKSMAKDVAGGGQGAAPDGQDEGGE